MTTTKMTICYQAELWLFLWSNQYRRRRLFHRRRFYGSSILNPPHLTKSFYWTLFLQSFYIHFTFNIHFSRFFENFNFLLRMSVFAFPSLVSQEVGRSSPRNRTRLKTDDTPALRPLESGAGSSGKKIRFFRETIYLGDFSRNLIMRIFSFLRLAGNHSKLLIPPSPPPPSSNPVCI